MTALNELQMVAIFLLCDGFLIGSAVAMVLCGRKDSNSG